MVLTIVILVSSFIVIMCFGMLTKGHAREVRLEQEKALRIGHEAGANWVFDMTVDEYVMHQSIRREVKTSQ